MPGTDPRAGTPGSVAAKPARLAFIAGHVHLVECELRASQIPLVA
jgi:hypothetical protein